jgi:uncharacterized membrane protein
MGQVLWFTDGIISVSYLQSTWHLLVSLCSFVLSTLVANAAIAC